MFHVLYFLYPAVRYVDAEIQVPSAGNPGLSKSFAFNLKPGVG